MARPPILTLTDIALSFGGDPLLQELGLSIHAGDRVALVGKNGSGKSTLMKIMAGFVEPDSGRRFLTQGLSVGYLQQDPDFIGFSTLGEFAASDLGAGDEYRVEMVAEGLKLPLDQTPERASGGERRRAALVKILAEAPDLMLLDEPTNHLDIEAISWLETYLQSGRTAFVVISHDRAFLNALSKATLWVDRGTVRRQEKGFDAFESWRDKVFEEEDLQRHKLKRLIKAEGRWAVEGISARRKRNQGRVRRLADLRAQRAGQIARQSVAKLELESGPKSGRMAIDGHNLTKKFDNKAVVRDFSIRIMRGERIALVGPNGAGKTTLVNILTKAISPDSGTVKHGTTLVPAIFDQNRSALNPNASLWDNLTQDKDLKINGKNDQIMVRGSARHVVGYLKDFLFDEQQARGPVRALSGGEKARLLLARLLAQESNLLVLDEPTNDLDIETLDLLQEILDDYDGTVILVSHDRDFLDRVATTTIAMEGNGKAVLYAGGWSDYQSQRQVQALKIVAKDVSKSAKSKPEQRVETKVQHGLSYTEAHRLNELPNVMAKLETEIKRLEQFLSDPELFTKEPKKFAKASEGLVERQNALSAAEDEWLNLEDRA